MMAIRRIHKTLKHGGKEERRILNSDFVIRNFEKQLINVKLQINS